MKIARGEKKLMICCAFAFLTLAGVATFYGHLNATPVIVAPPRPQTPVRNGADLALQAARGLTIPTPPVEANRDINPPADAKARAQRYSLARKTAWLNRNQTALALLKRSQQTEWLQPLRPFGKEPDVRPMLSLARAKIVESNAHWRRGDPNAALQSGLDIVQLGHDYQRGGNVYDYYTGNTLSGMSRATGDSIAHLSAAQAKNAARRLEKLLETRWTLRQAFEQEKFAEQQFFLDLCAGKNWRLIGLPATKPATWLDWRRISTIPKKQIIADIGAKYDREIANTRLPYARQKPPLTFAGDPFANYFQISTRAHFYGARALARDRVLLLQLALRAHQLERGAPPPNLQALVPAYLKAVPADPFGAGEPLRYRTDGASYTLWSIGSDGVDDGGKAIGWRKKAPKIYPDERVMLPALFHDSRGDYVAGKNY